MLNSIKKFLYNLNPDIIVQAPSRINLINPLDAVEGDYWMPSIAITGINNPLSVFLYIKKIEKESKLKIYQFEYVGKSYTINLISEETLLKNLEQIKEKISNKNKLVYASIYRFCKFNSCFEKNYIKSNFEIGLISTIPQQSGLGGSAAIIIATLYGFAKFFNLYNNFNLLKPNEFPINKDVIAEMATKIEDDDLKVTAGYGDRYVISRGGLCFCSYYGKLFHRELSQEPLATYDRIDHTYGIKDIPIIICFSGISHHSGNVHGRLRRLYLAKEQKILYNYKKLADIAWKSRFAIMKHDWKLLGKYFKENTNVMNSVMQDAGFKYGIGLANNILIEIVEKHPDVYAAKLTGAGGGGSVFALVNPEEIDAVLSFWKEKLVDLIHNKKKFISKFPSYPIEITDQLKNAQFYKIKINTDGVKKL
ncbi:MAG: mevalonate kinase [Promethearchaeota archaeon]